MNLRKLWRGAFSPADAALKGPRHNNWKLL